MFAKTRSARIATMVTTKMTAMHVRSTRSSRKLQRTAKSTAQEGVGGVGWGGAHGSARERCANGAAGREGGEGGGARARAGREGTSDDDDLGEGERELLHGARDAAEEGTDVLGLDGGRGRLGDARRAQLDQTLALVALRLVCWEPVVLVRVDQLEALLARRLAVREGAELHILSLLDRQRHAPSHQR
eukprot:scaffold7804_cov65-Phaeocystis_antarctica.AAC.1